MTGPKSAYGARTKYDERKAHKYQHRNPARDRAEMRMVDRAFAAIPKTHRVLDVPCGGGRIALRLGAHGYRVAAGDLSEAMLAIARQRATEAGLHCPVEKLDVEQLSHGDRAFDTIVTFRLFHHFPTPEIRQRVVNELCRVARKFVVLSYFSPLSVTSLRRKLHSLVGKKKSAKNYTPLAEVEGYFAKAGFRLVKDFAQTPFLRTLHLAVFERVGETQP